MHSRYSSMEAPNYQPIRTKSSLGLWAVTALLVLLMVPFGALSRLAQFVDPLYLGGYCLMISGVTYGAYRHDKRCAVKGEQRLPEGTLHFMELLGGWPGAFLAQRALRHKVVKTSYQVTYWCIVALYEYVAFDCTQDWRWSRHLLALLSVR